MSDLVRILTANVYVGNNTRQKCSDKIDDLNPHGAALQEASAAIDQLRNSLDRYRFAHNATKQGSGTPVLVLKNLDETGGMGSVFGCEEVPDTKCGKDRWITYSVTRLPGSSDRRVVIGSHFNCGVQNDDGTPCQNSRMVERYKTQSDRLVELIRLFRALSWSPIIAADWNYRLKGKITEPGQATDWSPYGIARRLDLRYEANRIDGVMWDPKRYALDRRQVIPMAETGSDHDWLMVYLDPK